VASLAAWLAGAFATISNTEIDSTNNLDTFAIVSLIADRAIRCRLRNLI
jgi:hypothetical protein